jgi:hypothetical protein
MSKYQTAFEYLGKNIGPNEGYKLAVLANMLQTPPEKRLDTKTKKEVNTYNSAILDLYFKELPKSIMDKLDLILKEHRLAQVAMVKNRK